MAGRNDKSLFLTVGGTVAPLTTELKAGRTVLNQFGGAAIDTAAEVRKAFEALGGDGIGAELKQVEKSFDRTFAAIRANAKSIIDAPTGAAALDILNAGAAQQAATAAEGRAQSLRILADAAARSASATTEDATAARVYATAAETAAQGAEREAAALREQATVLTGIEGHLRDVAAARGIEIDATTRSTGASNQQRQGMIQLGEQFRQFSTSVLGGAGVVQSFTQQSGQAAFALTLFDGKLGKVGTALAGVWGTVGIIAISIIGDYIAKTIEAGDAVKNETDELKKNAEKAAIAEQAKRAFAFTEAGAIDDVRALTEELRKQNDELKTNAERQNIRSKLRLGTLNDARNDVSGQIAGLQSELATLKQPGNRDATGSATGIAQRESQIAALETRLTNIDKAIADAQAARVRTDADLAAEAAKRAVDPVEQIKRRYEGPDGLIEQAKKRAIAEGAVNTELTRQLTTLARQEKAEIDAAQKRERQSQKTPSLGDQVSATQGASLFASASQYRGLSETRDNGTLRQLFDQANINVDPKMTAWCAAFVNAVLATNGLPGTGSLSARSFLTYGSETKKPQVGDIVVARRGTGDQGHVGFYQGTDAKGNVLVLGGNTGNKVGTERIAQKDILGFRSVPSAGDAQKSSERAAAAAERQAQQDAQNRADYARDVDQAQAGYVRAQQGLASSIEDQLAFEVDQIDLQKQARDAAIDKLVAAKKIPGATEAEVQANAGMLRALNDNQAALETAAATREAQQRILDRNLQSERDQLQSKGNLLQLQLDLATTTVERKRIALKLLAIEEQLALDEANRKIASNDPGVQAQGRLDLAQVGAEHPLRVEQINRQNADPLQSYLDRLKNSTGDMNDALKGVEADGLQSLEDGLLGIIDGTESVASAFKKMASAIIADLARIAIEKAIVSLIGNAAGHADGGSVGGSHESAHGFMNGGALDRFDGGGQIRGPGTGRSDSILALVNGRKPIRVSNGEFIVNEASTRRYRPIIEAINRGTLPAYADGGAISAAMSLPQVPDMRAMGAPSINIDMSGNDYSIHAPGADPAALARVEANQRRMEAEFPARVQAAVIDATQRNMLRRP